MPMPPTSKTFHFPSWFSTLVTYSATLGELCPWNSGNFGNFEAILVPLLTVLSLVLTPHDALLAWCTSICFISSLCLHIASFSLAWASLSCSLSSNSRWCLCCLSSKSSFLLLRSRCCSCRSSSTLRLSISCWFSQTPVNLYWVNQTPCPTPNTFPLSSNLILHCLHRINLLCWLHFMNTLNNISAQ